jgi:hypothetical protein
MTQDVSNEARDAKGKWTVGASGGDNHAHPAGPYMSVSDAANAPKADRVALIAAKVAEKLDFPAHVINISDESKTFELNGKTLPVAGWATRPAVPQKASDEPTFGVITLFTQHIGEYTRDIEGVTAHEIMHQKWNAFQNDQRSESLKMQEDPDYHKENKLVTFDPANPVHAAQKAEGNVVFDNGQIREKGFMRPDGLLNEPYASKYPAYQAYTKAMMPSLKDFAKSDGVSDYSREYWKGAWIDRTIGPDKAYHETLAEIGRLKYEGMPTYHAKLGEVEGKPVYFLQSLKKGVKPVWSTLYKAVNENWKRRSK